MLRIIQTKSAGGAKSYYSKSDYLSEGQELTGYWYGKAAGLLGLEGTVGKQEFDRLCDNQHPTTGEQLTLRNSDGRTVGYDFNFHVPKGLSVAYELMGDDRVLDAFNQAVDATMHEIEDDAATRVRKHFGNIDRNVGNLVWSKFIHKTARPVDGVPDPHLHAHCFVQNIVFDEKEDAWKAGQFRDIKRDARYYEAVFHARLAANAKSLGYNIERRGKYWDIAQVPEAVVTKFSRRTEVIEDLAKRKGVTDVEMKSELGASSREAKESNLSMPELRQIWQGRLTEDEAASLTMPGTATRDLRPSKNAESMRYATEHCFEQSSVVPKRHLLAEALRHGVGDVSVEGVAEELQRQKVIVRKIHSRPMATTAKVLAEEKAMIDFVKNGRDSQHPFVSDYHPQREWLNYDQRAAVISLLGSSDRVTLIRGGAGTGKTTMMTEAIEAIEKAGTPVHTFAPSAEASRGVLASEGFKATTVAELLVSKKLQGEVAGAVLWIDEAGLLSSRQLKGVVDIADRCDCRIVLSGDPNQHKSVERGDVLQMLENERALKPILVQQIERQKGSYKQAVEYLSRGNTEKGIDELEALGWVHAVADSEQRLTMMAGEYADQVAQGKSTLVVAPTHAEAAVATSAIREELKSRKLIGRHERSLRQLKPVHLTTAEKSDASRLKDDDVLVFHQNLPGIKRGSSQRATPELIEKATQFPDRFSVYRESTVDLAKGDKVRITRSGETLNGKHRLYNGNVFNLKGFDRRGNLVLQNGWKIDKEYGHVSLGYVSTSHASQGKTVDEVFVIESSTSFPAAGSEQLYVSVSRGRKRATIFTDDLAEFRQAVSRHDERVTATAMMQAGTPSHRLRRRRSVRLEQENEISREPNREAEYARR